MAEFRIAILEDYSAIANLHADNWRKTYRGILTDQYLDNEVEQERLETWRRRFLQPPKNQQVIVAVNNGDIIGFSCLLLDDDAVFGSLIDNLHVAVNVHKSGIGKLLMQESGRIIISKATTPGMYLWVYEQNKNARAFYDRMKGQHFETVIKENESGNKVPVCRYVWEDVALLTNGE